MGSRSYKTARVIPCIPKTDAYTTMQTHCGQILGCVMLLTNITSSCYAQAEMRSRLQRSVKLTAFHTSRFFSNIVSSFKLMLTQVTSLEAIYLAQQKTFHKKTFSHMLLYFPIVFPKDLNALVICYVNYIM